MGLPREGTPEGRRSDAPQAGGGGGGGHIQNHRPAGEAICLTFHKHIGTVLSLWGVYIYSGVKSGRVGGVGKGVGRHGGGLGDGILGAHDSVQSQCIRDTEYMCGNDPDMLLIGS